MQYSTKSNIAGLLKVFFIPYANVGISKVNRKKTKGLVVDGRELDMKFPGQSRTRRSAILPCRQQQTAIIV